MRNPDNSQAHVLVCNKNKIDFAVKFPYKQVMALITNGVLLFIAMIEFK
jgi:hypothetical protein